MNKNCFIFQVGCIFVYRSVVALKLMSVGSNYTRSGFVPRRCGSTMRTSKLSFVKMLFCENGTNSARIVVSGRSCSQKLVYL